MADLQRASRNPTGSVAYLGRTLGDGYVSEETPIRASNSSLSRVKPYSVRPTLTLASFKSYEVQPPRHVRLLQKIKSDKVPVLLRFSRYPLTGWQRKRNPDLPAPALAQLEAADAVQFIAKKNSITLPAVKGDMLFVNDMALMHARQGFDDGDIPLKRHLIKMYLRDPDKGWEIPSSIEREWGTSYNPNRPDGTRHETWHIFHEPGLEELTMLNG